MNEKEKSPFSESTFEEQMQQWIKWRSRHLDYEEECNTSTKPCGYDPAPIRIPAPVISTVAPIAPYRHSQLDAINARHKSAARQLSVWQNAVMTQTNAAAKQ